MSPASKSVAAPKLPPGPPSSTETVSERVLATARSGSESPLNSPTATETGPLPAAKSVAAPKLPPAPPSSTGTLSELKLATAKSGSESPLKSPTATDWGSPAAKLIGCVEAPAGGAEQHRDVVGVAVGDRKVGVGVAVEVAHRDRGGQVAGIEVGRAGEADLGQRGRRRKPQQGQPGHQREHSYGGGTVGIGTGHGNLSSPRIEAPAPMGADESGRPRETLLACAGTTPPDRATPFNRARAIAPD